MDNKLTYKNIIDKILILFPEYKNTVYFEDNDKNLQYSFASGFANYVCEQIKNSDHLDNSEQIKMYFDFFNEIFKSDDSELINLATVEILEILAQEEKTKFVAELQLNKEGKYWLSEVLKYTGV